MRTAIVTISTSKAAGQGEDRSGPRLAELARAAGAEVVETVLVADDRERIEELLTRLADSSEVDLVLTTGGTGVAPSDVTPEATAAVVERPVPGLAEAMRASSLVHNPHAMLSRGVAGIRGGTLIVNLPGSPKGASECFEAVAASLPHAVALLRGEDAQHGG